MRFLWPDMLWLLLAVPAMVATYAWVLARRRRRALRYASLRLVRAAITPGARLRRHVPPALFLAGATVALFAMARPMASIVLPAEFMTLVLAMDVSRSMLAKDVAPDRITAAQTAARAFIETVPKNIRVGITSFAGTAEVVQTPTESKEEMLAAVNRFELQRHTATGSGLLVSLNMLRPDAGIDLEKTIFGKEFGGSGGGDPETRARRLLKSETKSLPPVAVGSYTGGAIVLMSDGRRTTGPDPIAAAKLAANLGVRVYTIGFGTKEGAEIPGAEGYSFFARLDEDTLRAVAAITGAEYFHAGTAEDLKKVYQNLSLQFAMERRDTEVSAIAAGVAALLLMLACGLSLLWFRRPAAANA